MLASSLRHCRLPMPDDTRGRPIALLSLFDGLGTARLAVDEVLRMEGGSVRLVGSWYAEWHAPLRDAVERLWARRHAVTGCRRHEPVANDVWDLLRGDGQRLRGILDTIPESALLLIIGGSPCQQLTTIGTGGGHLGLAGRDSVFFFSFSLRSLGLYRPCGQTYMSTR